MKALLVCVLALGAHSALGAHGALRATTCEDRGTPQYCEDHKNSCDDPFGSDTKFYCKKTCGLCSDSTPAPGDCSDRGTLQYCQENKELCDDPFASDVRFYCRETCGLCKNPNVIYTTRKTVVSTSTSSSCSDIYVDCEQAKYKCTNPVFPEFKEKCRKTCGVCTDPNAPPTTPSTCSDVYMDCVQAKYKCTNPVFPEFKQKCRKTCGLC